MKTNIDAPDLEEAVEILIDITETFDERISEIEKTINRPSFVTVNGKTIPVQPEKGDRFFRVISASFSIDGAGTEHERRNKAAHTVCGYLSTWSKKPGFKIETPPSFSQVGDKMIVSTLISVNRTHYSQEDF